MNRSGGRRAEPFALGYYFLREPELPDDSFFSSLLPEVRDWLLSLLLLLPEDLALGADCLVLPELCDLPDDSGLEADLWDTVAEGFLSELLF